MTGPAADGAPAAHPPATDPEPSPETTAPKETAMTTLAETVHTTRLASPRAATRRGAQALPTRAYGQADPRPVAPPRVRAVPAPARGDLLDAEPAPVVPLVRVSGRRVVADLDELADRARRLTSGDAAATAAPAPAGEQSELPDPTRLCCAVVRGAVEVARGDRPVAQLARWVSPEVLEALSTRAALVRGLPRPPRVPRPALVRRARVVRLSPTSAEASVVVEDVDRVRAAALRVEAHRGQWRVVALEIG
ncbi:Rv3235 family protein [Luteimicrobium sp. DT211]|uniref:Rv3235 family protein n=1 Tax=Luteimicrobium sp. DT211 TaxID=3393412 RepID=UPI003CFAF4E2